jgi:large subunit ribosomal protein L4
VATRKASKESTESKANLLKVNLKGEEVGKVEVSESIATATANSQMIKDYIVALRANARQWNAHTKGRSDVNHSTKKPHAQKGTGNARQGSLAATQYKGGGRPFGPKTKYDQHVRINKKEKQAAIRALLADKIQANQFFVIENPEMTLPKTRDIQNFMDARNLVGKTLFLGDSSFVDVQVDEVTQRFMIPTDKHDVFVKSIRNIPNACFKLVSSISGYDVILANHIVITEAAFDQLQDWLVKG